MHFSIRNSKLVHRLLKFFLQNPFNIRILHKINFRCETIEKSKFSEIPLTGNLSKVFWALLLRRMNLQNRAVPLHIPLENLFHMHGFSVSSYCIETIADFFLWNETGRSAYISFECFPSINSLVA